jgi:hypothetical protein
MTNCFIVIIQHVPSALLANGSTVTLQASTADIIKWGFPATYTKLFFAPENLSSATKGNITSIPSHTI